MKNCQLLCNTWLQLLVQMFGRHLWGKGLKNQTKRFVAQRKWDLGKIFNRHYHVICSIVSVFSFLRSDPSHRHSQCYRPLLPLPLLPPSPLEFYLHAYFLCCSFFFLEGAF
eukprot:Lithocolla_globosa_v1_NODE_2564_length_1952_cov_44.540327.p3 type:complete len:111 gc:universal NODE_2564_length_1952_cov_44.540327:1268-936(-)